MFILKSCFFLRLPNFFWLLRMLADICFVLLIVFVTRGTLDTLSNFHLFKLSKSTKKCHFRSLTFAWGMHFQFCWCRPGSHIGLNMEGINWPWQLWLLSTAWLLSPMSLPRFPPTNCTVEADQVSSAHELSGRDSARQPENSPTDTLGVAGVSQVATPNYSKRPSGNKFFPQFSFLNDFLCEFC